VDYQFGPYHDIPIVGETLDMIHVACFEKADSWFAGFYHTLSMEQNGVSYNRRAFQAIEKPPDPDQSHPRPSHTNAVLENANMLQPILEPPLLNLEHRDPQGRSLVLSAL
jgi:hypothetical protein